RIADGVVGDEFERLPRRERLLPGGDAAALFPAQRLRLGLEERLHRDLVRYRDRRRFQHQQLDRRLVAAGDRVLVDDLAFGALPEDAARAVAVLQTVHGDLDAVVAAERQHEALFRLRVPVGRADVAAVAVELHIAGGPPALGEGGLR